VQESADDSNLKISENPSLDKIIVSSMTTSSPDLLSSIYDSQLQNLDNLIKKSNSEIIEASSSNHNLQKNESLNLLNSIPGLNNDITNLSETSIELVNSDSQIAFQNIENTKNSVSKIPIKNNQNQPIFSNVKQPFSPIILNNKDVPIKIPVYKKLSKQYILSPSYIYENNNNENISKPTPLDNKVFSSNNRKSKAINDKIDNNNTSKLPRGACSLSTHEIPTNKKPAIFSKYYFKNKIHLISNENGMYYIKEEEYKINGR